VPRLYFLLKNTCDTLSRLAEVLQFCYVYSHESSAICKILWLCSICFIPKNPSINNMMT